MRKLAYLILILALAAWFAPIGAQQVINGYRIFAAVTAPSTPAAGTAAVYIDSTTKKLCNKDDAGVVSCTGASSRIVCQQNQQSGVTFSTVAGTFTTLMSCTLPANQLATNNTCVVARAVYHYSSNGASSNYQWKLGSTATASIADTGTGTTQTTSTVIACENGTNTQQMNVTYYAKGATIGIPPVTVAPTETTSGTIALLLQASCNATCSSAPVLVPDIFLVEAVQ